MSMFGYCFETIHSNSNRNLSMVASASAAFVDSIVSLSSVVLATAVMITFLLFPYQAPKSKFIR